MINSKIIFSAIFLILSYYMIVYKDILKDCSPSDLFLFTAVTILAGIAMLTNIFVLRKYKENTTKENAINILYLVSAAVYLISAIRPVLMFLK